MSQLLVNFYPFQWNFGDEKNRRARPYTNYRGEIDYPMINVIRIWGWNERNETVCVRIEDFRVPMWVELPQTLYESDVEIDWNDQSLVNEVIDAFTNNQLKEFEVRKIVVQKDGENIEKPIMAYPPRSNNYNIEHDELYRLYDCDYVREENNTVSRKRFHFLRFDFTSSANLQKMVKYLERPTDVPKLGLMKFRCFCESHKLTPVMKLLAMRQLPSTNWLILRLPELITNKTSNKDHEYVVNYSNISAHPNPDSLPLVHPLVCSFDIETYSSQYPKFPNPSLPDDKMLIIGCTFARKGQVSNKTCLSLMLNPEAFDEECKRNADKCEKREDHVMLLENRDDYIIEWYRSEQDLIRGWRDIIRKHNPDVLIGYNIFKFDLTYMQARAKYLTVEPELLDISCCSLVPGKMGGTCWESEARGKVEMKWIDAQGRLFIDLYPVIQASENLQSYKLEFVANKYLGMHKDPISPRDIFDSWKKKNQRLYNEVIKYCAQDTMLPLLLFEKLLIWLGLTESASTNKVPIFTMVTQGQQIKAFSQVFDFCYQHKMVCNPPPKKAKENYRGAIVTEPIAGLYKMILPFDFASLYPSIIIAHNLDFSTFLTEEQAKKFKYVKYAEDDPRFVNNDNEVECFEWEDHVLCGCPKDEMLPRDANGNLLPVPEKKPRKNKNGELIVAKRPKNAVCASYKYWFMKNKVMPGVIPTIIKDLLAARKKVRKVIEKNEDTIHELEEKLKDPQVMHDAVKKDIMRLKDLNKVLDKRQLAYKVNANSMYGMFGAETGYLPFFPGAETVTFVGRRSIMAASHRLETKHGGKVIYNDTDSAYCYFESQSNRTVDEVWQFATDVVEDIATLFPPPMKLEFEGKIYVRFLIFTKKKYVAQMLDQHGKLKENMYLRGVPLVRREYCDNMKQIYEGCIRYSLNNIDVLTHLDKKDVVQMKKNPHFHHFYMMIFQHFLNVMRRNVSKKEPEVVIEEVEDEDESGRPMKRVKVSGGPTSIEGVSVEENAGNYYKDFVIYKTLKKEQYANKQAHSAVADKIRARGTPVDVNTRIEFVMLAESDELFDKTKCQYEICDDLAYFLQFREILRLDFLKYIDSQYVNYLNQTVKVVFGVDGVVTEMFKRLVQKNKMMYELKMTVLKLRVKMHDKMPGEHAVTEMRRTSKEKIAMFDPLFDKNYLQWASLLHGKICKYEKKQPEQLLPSGMLCEQYVTLLYHYFMKNERDAETLYKAFQTGVDVHTEDPQGWKGWLECWRMDWSVFQASKHRVTFDYLLQQIESTVKSEQASKKTKRS